MSFIRAIFMTLSPARDLSSCEAALCSAGSSVRVQRMSSRNSIVRFFRWWLPSKSCHNTTHVLIKLSIISDKATWPCLVTQCLSTDSTLMVAAELVMDIFLLAASRKESLEAFWSMEPEFWCLFLRLSLLFSSPYWGDPEGCWSRQLLLQKPQQPEQSLTFNV